MTDLNSILKTLSLSFANRAIARALEAMLLEGPKIGSVVIDLPRWASASNVSENTITASLSALQQAGYWQVISEAAHDTLCSKAIEASSRAISRQKKRAALSKVKAQSTAERNTELTLDKADIAQKSLYAEIVEKIPFETRYDELSRGYQGWLPTDKFGACGMVYRCPASAIEELARMYPEVDIDLALSMMYEDLKTSHHHRPSISTFQYWIKNWMKKNASRVKDMSAVQNNTLSNDDLFKDY